MFFFRCGGWFGEDDKCECVFVCVCAYEKKVLKMIVEILKKVIIFLDI